MDTHAIGPRGTDVELGALAGRDTAASAMSVSEPASTILRMGALVDGMTCVVCSTTIERALAGMAGVLEASVSLSTRSLLAKIDTSVTSADAVVDMVEAVGFGGKLLWSREVKPAHAVTRRSKMGGADMDGEAEENEVSFERLDSGEEVQVELGAGDDMAAGDEEEGVSGMRASLAEKVRSSLFRTPAPAKLTTLELAQMALRDNSDDTPENALLPGISTVYSRGADVFTVVYDPQEIGPRDIRDRLEQHNIRVRVLALSETATTSRAEEAAQKEIEKMRRIFFTALFFALPLLFLTMVFTRVPGASQALLSNAIGHGVRVIDLLAFVLATPVQFWCGGQFYRGAWKSVSSRGILGMDFLIAVGTSAAYIYSLASLAISLANDKHVAGAEFFETASTLITVVLLGKLLQAIARQHTSRALMELSSLQPVSTILVTDDGDVSIPPELAQPGDLLRLMDGERVPCDGVLVSGGVATNEAMLTGESMPVTKELGDDLVGGTVLAEGTGVMQVTAVGAGSILGKIISLMENAQASKPPIQEFADRASSIFVPVVAAISLLTLTVWLSVAHAGVAPASWYDDVRSPTLFAFRFALAVWVIACPCALGLATPTAIMVGTTVAARNGVLIKDGAAFQRAAELHVVVFDKTGTLTDGRPSVTHAITISEEGGVVSERRVDQLLYAQQQSQQAADETGSDDRVDSAEDQSVLLTASAGGKAVSQNNPIQSQAGNDEHELSDITFYRLLFAAESASSHPLAVAIREFAEAELQRLGAAPDATILDTDATRIIVGRGVSCVSRTGTRILIGNRALMRLESGIQPSKLVKAHVTHLQKQGNTVVYVAVAGHLRALLGISDPIKPDAIAAVAALQHQQRKQVWMVTGDQPTVAFAVARILDIPEEHVVAGVNPAQKAATIESLQERGLRVAFVGDGVNDSPALAQADVGMAMGSGTNIAAEAADLVLTRNRVIDVLLAAHVARTVFVRIKINLGFSLVFNALGIPVAAGVFYPLIQVALPPVVAGAAMALSSLAVLVSSLLLRLYTPPTYRTTSSSNNTEPESEPGDADEAV